MYRSGSSLCRKGRDNDFLNREQPSWGLLQQIQMSQLFERLLEALSYFTTSAFYSQYILAVKHDC